MRYIVFFLLISSQLTLHSQKRIREISLEKKEPFNLEKFKELNLNSNLVVIYAIAKSKTSDAEEQFVKDSLCYTGMHDPFVVLLKFDPAGSDKNHPIFLDVPLHATSYLLYSESFGFLNRISDLTSEYGPDERIRRIRVQECTSTDFVKLRDIVKPRVEEIKRSYDENLDEIIILRNLSILNAKVDILSKKIGIVDTLLVAVTNKPEKEKYSQWVFSSLYSFGGKKEYNMDDYKKSPISVSNRSGFEVGLRYEKRVILNSALMHGLGCGIAWTRNDNTMSVDSCEFVFDDVDPEGTSYKKHVLGINLRELVYYNALSLPVYYTLSAGNKEKFSFSAYAGLQLNYISSSFSVPYSGSFSYRGQYQGISMNLQNVPSLGFVENVNVSKEKTFTELKRYAIGFIVGANAQFSLVKNLDLRIESKLNFSSDIKNDILNSNAISKEPGEYSSMVNSLPRLNSNPVFFGLGLVFKGF